MQTFSSNQKMENTKVAKSSYDGSDNQYWENADPSRPFSTGYCNSLDMINLKIFTLTNQAKCNKIN